MSESDDRLVDGHVHLLDFMQRTDGAPSLIEAMDASGVERAVVFGLPVKKKWDSEEPGRPSYYMDDVARCYYYSLTDELVVYQLDALPDSDRTRLVPLACGFDPTDLSAPEQIEDLFDRHPGIWRGVGEVLLRHDELSSRLTGELPRANHPAMRRVAEFCGQRGVPLLLHSNASARGHEPEAYVREIEELLRMPTIGTIVWAHAGISEIHREHDHTPTLARLLSDHELLHLDISWAGLAGALDDSGTLDVRWTELIERFPDRVVIGSDVVGRFGSLANTIEHVRAVLDSLAEPTRAKVAHLNAERLWFSG